jgi:hypothetical protein
MLTSFKATLNSNYNGEFRITKVLTFSSSGTPETTYYEGMAFLYGSHVSVFSPWLASNSGSVKLNNVPLYYNSPVKAYMDSSYRKNLTLEDIKWELSGSSNLPDFVVDIDSVMPGNPSLQVLPPTINKSSNVVVNLHNLVNTDCVEFMIEDNLPHVVLPWYRKIYCNGPHLNIVIPKSNLNDLTVTQNAVLRMIFTKTTTRTINGKNFKFENRVMIVKPLTINN